ncbi:MAG: sugar-binding domain-containing protein, partial [Balneola sp.]
MLYPQQNNYRTVFDLSGFWKIKADPQNLGHDEKWYSSNLEGDTHTIAIPGSWNEQLEEQGLKNYVGKAWHETTFRIPQAIQKDHKIWLRIGAADHQAEVWLNGENVGSHFGGYMPFGLDLTESLNKSGEINHLVVCVDSSLSMHSLPQGVDPESDLYNTKNYDRRHLFPATRFDFFPYGGLTRSVNIIAVQENHITDIDVNASLDGSIEVQVSATSDSLKKQIRVL